MPIVKTTAKGQFVIPKEVREKLGIKPTQKIAIKVVKDHAEIRPLPEDPIKYLCGIFKTDKKLTEELLKERRKDLKFEEQKIAGLVCPADVPETRKRV